MFSQNRVIVLRLGMFIVFIPLTVSCLSLYLFLSLYLRIALSYHLIVSWSRDEGVLVSKHTAKDEDSENQRGTCAQANPQSVLGCNPTLSRTEHESNVTLGLASALRVLQTTIRHTVDSFVAFSV